MELIFLCGFKRLAPAEILVDWSEIDPEPARVRALAASVEIALAVVGLLVYLKKRHR